MSGCQHDLPMAKCGCGGNGVLWEREVPFTKISTVEAFCSRHCGLKVGSIMVKGPKTAAKVARIWNRALGAGK